MQANKQARPTVVGCVLGEQSADARRGDDYKGE
jgi:hypothetical protein